ncbi:MAG: hypothetical protein FJ387_08865 [Verrucomicrobia bacterium]|nr:hypothetical protein [Verrucomicrobiota bacterium]
MDPSPPPPRDNDLLPPPRLVAALRQLRPPTVPVPRHVDETVLRHARERLAHPFPAQAVPARKNLGLALLAFAKAVRQQLRPAFMPWAAVAVAAAVILGVWLVPRWAQRDRAPNTHRTSAAAEDINRDGRVDVLDAYALALELEQGHRSSSDRLRDLNGDGVTDRHDVEFIAYQAVRLEHPTRL